MSEFEFTVFKVFGWYIHRKQLRAGDSFTANIPTGYDVKNAGNISLYTKGHVTGVNVGTGELLEPRVPGWSILKQRTVKPGNYLFTAEVDSEFWCINSIRNRKRMPKVEVLSVLRGDSYFPPTYEKIFFCAGTIEDQHGAHHATPFSGDVSNPFFAVDDLHGFIFRE